MPRLARLDAPGVLHHVMARGIEGRKIFLEDEDREDFVRRLAALATSAALVVYGWALIPNHLHLVVRTAGAPLWRSMRSLMSGYAGQFNRRAQVVRTVGIGPQGVYWGCRKVNAESKDLVDNIGDGVE